MSDAEFREALANPDYIRLIRSRLKHYYRWALSTRLRRVADYAEFEQAGRIALWKTLRGYDPTKGTKFTTCLYHQIGWAVSDVMETWERLSRFQVPFEESLEPVEQKEMPNWSPEPNLLPLLNKLPNRHKHVLSQVFIKGRPLMQIYGELGISKFKFDSMLNAALIRLRRVYYRVKEESQNDSDA